MAYHRLFCLPALILMLMVSASPLVAQQPWSWPEKPANIQVLPKDWPGSRLRPVMVGFTRALGVRCSHCHVGEEGKPLSSYDFASDENPNKNRAREMLKMLGLINDALKNIEPSGDKRVNMWCHTCHNGRPRPMTLEEELGEKYRAGGVEAALAHYTTLKQEFHGKGAYNFSEGALNTFGYELLQQEDLAGAVAVFLRNSEEFPESANVWDSLGEGYLKAGDKALAEQAYRKSLALNPNNANARKMLQQMAEQKD